jgi:hypothetical protein
MHYVQLSFVTTNRLFVKLCDHVLLLGEPSENESLDGCGM